MYPRMQTKVVVYRHPMTFAIDARLLAAEGWTVAQTMERTGRSGLLRLLFLGSLGALAFHPKPEIVVTYVRHSTG